MQSRRRLPPRQHVLPTVGKESGQGYDEELRSAMSRLATANEIAMDSLVALSSPTPRPTALDGHHTGLLKSPQKPVAGCTSALFWGACATDAGTSILIVSTYYEEQMYRMRILDAERQHRVALWAARANIWSGLFEGYESAQYFNEPPTPFFDPIDHTPRIVAEQLLRASQINQCSRPMAPQSEPLNEARLIVAPYPSLAASDFPEHLELVELCREYQSVVRDQQATIRGLEEEVCTLSCIIDSSEKRDFEGAGEVLEVLSQCLRRGEADALAMVRQSAHGYAKLPSSLTAGSGCECDFVALKELSVRLHKHLIASQDAALVLRTALSKAK